VAPTATPVPKHSVTFDANGGSCATPSAQVNASNKLNALPTAYRTGYVFVGWYKEDGTAVTLNTVFPEAATVHARWAKAAHVTDPDKNAFKGDIAMSDPDVLNLLVDAADMEANEDILVYMEVKELADNAVTAADKNAILNKAGTDPVAAYLDIKLMKKIGNQTPFAIRNTRRAVPITMVLPDEMIPQNASNDSFYIVYYHDGVAKSIPATFNKVTKELAFNADEFSTYALVYTVHLSVPQTGDTARPYAWMLMLLCSAALMAGVVFFDKKKVM